MAPRPAPLPQAPWPVALLVLIWSLSNGATDPGPETSSQPRLPFEIEVTGDEYEWHIRYPGADGELSTSDDPHARQNIHLPMNTDATIHLTSTDYLYSFALPHVGVKEIAVPELVFRIDFVTGAEGIYELLGDQMCGFSHPALMGKLVVESPEDFERWLSSARDTPSRKGP